jgi:CRP-like cAMP-binding protein
MLHDRSVELLYALPLFSGWDPVSLQAIAYVNTRLFLAPGEELLVAGKDAPGATLIVDGTARQSDSLGEEVVRQYGPGTLLDEMAMFVPTTSQLNIVAETPLEVLRISRDRMRDILHNDPSMAGVLAQRIQGRLLAIADQLRVVEDMLGPPDGEPLEGADEAEGEVLEADAAVSRDEDRTPQEPARDRKADPSPEPRQQPALSATSHSEAA